MCINLNAFWSLFSDSFCTYAPLLSFSGLVGCTNTHVTYVHAVGYTHTHTHSHTYTQHTNTCMMGK